MNLREVMSEYALNRQEWNPSHEVDVVFDEPGFQGTVDHWTGYMTQPSYLKVLEVRSPLITGSHKIWNSFEHYKCQANISSGSGNAIVTVRPLFQNTENAKTEAGGPYLLYNSNVFGAPGLLSDGLQPLYIPNAGPTGFIPDPDGLPQLIEAALKAILPLIRPELSSVNTVLELKDFKSVAGTIRNIRKLPRGLLRRARAFRTIWEVLRVASDVYLQAKFNINPLISDITGVYRAVAKTQARLNAFVSRAGKLQVSHYAKDLPTGLPQDPEVEPTVRPVGFYRLNGGSYQQSNSYATNTRQVISDASKFHAQIQYNYLYDDYQLEHARVLALLDSFGANLNPAIIWNAIPWSFVVDWFVDVGQWLSKQRIGHMDPKINIMQMCWSTKRTRRIFVSSRIASAKYYPGTGLPDVYYQHITHPVVFETAYKRSSGLPSASSITSSGLNSTEFSLGAALVITRRRHRQSRAR